jgi:hypothetical protein
VAAKATPSANAPDSWREMLAATPIPNGAAEVEQTKTGLLITVAIEKPASLPLPLRWVIHPRKERRLALDALGKAAWELCDGKRTVEEIIDAFAGRYDLEFHESRVAVTEYLRTLVQRGALAMRMDDKKRDG